MNQEDIIKQKQNLRKIVKELKKNISKEKIYEDSQRIFGKVESLPQFKKAKTVLVYWSLPDEVSTHVFVMKWTGEKKMVLPIVVGDTLELRTFNGLNELFTNNSFGIQEPLSGDLVNPADIDCAIIPGVAFDIKGNRLGRGKGFYDRFLKQTNAYLIAVGFDFQILESVPVSSLDVAVNIVISTKN
ncbi:MAG: 5-formyltetrahydrofolate cyclo-ligase [Bacteroidales bacterium]|nr:5-formyltetrahydrofolate cyclo-ligase [Bacteroidales bacterium]